MLRSPVTTPPGWLTRSLDDVPAGDHWLGNRELEVLGQLQLAHRRRDWRLGRWTAKAALGAWLDAPSTRIEVLAAADGAPEAWLDGQPAPVSVSLSHRAGRSLAVVAGLPRIVGCDLEALEPRSSAFVREWLGPAEQRVVSSRTDVQRILLVNLMWAGKEAFAKMRRQGLRLDVRSVAVAPEHEQQDPPEQWRPFQVGYEDSAGLVAGWWCVQPGWVIAVATEPACDRPIAL